MKKLEAIMSYRILSLYISFTLSVLIVIFIGRTFCFEPICTISLGGSLTYLCIFIAWKLGKKADRDIIHMIEEDEYAYIYR